MLKLFLVTDTPSQEWWAVVAEDRYQARKYLENKFSDQKWFFFTQEIPGDQEISFGSNCEGDPCPYPHPITLTANQWCSFFFIIQEDVKIPLILEGKFYNYSKGKGPPIELPKEMLPKEV